MHDLQCSSEKEVKIKKRPMEKIPEPSNSLLMVWQITRTQSSTGVRRRYSLAKESEAQNLKCSGTQKQVNTNTKKRNQQVAIKTVKIAKKVKEPITFEQKYHTKYGKILTHGLGANTR